MLPQVNIIRAKNGDFLSIFEREGISGVLTASGVWDELTIGIAKTLIDTNKVKPNVLDIGANMGTFTIPIAKFIDPLRGNIHSFEPQRLINYQLCGNIFLNRIDNAYTYHLALSDWQGFDEVEVLDYSEAWNIGAFSLIPGKDPQKRMPQKELMEFKKLDDIPFSSRITLIKIDVEGMELKVLTGGMKRIQEDGFPPILFESLGSDSSDVAVFELLTSKGYSCVQYSHHDWLAQHPEWDVEIRLINKDNVLSYVRVR